jgi:hypothetical protein
MDQSELRKAMDACRVGSEDLDLPELSQVAESLAADSAARRLFDRIQRFDRRIAAVARDVPVPAGLAERILARLPSSSEPVSNGLPTAKSALAIVRQPAVHSVSPAAGPRRRRFSKRAWSLTGLAASLLIAVGLVVFWPAHKPLSASTLIGSSGDWFAQLADGTTWQDLTGHERDLANYPPANALRVRPQRWSNVSSLVGEDAVVYDLSTAGHRAFLFVIPNDDPVAGPVPPSTPPSSTGGRMIGCWQSQGMVYVLVVEGDERVYQNLIDSSAQPPLA